MKLFAKMMNECTHKRHCEQHPEQYDLQQWNLNSKGASDGIEVDKTVIHDDDHLMRCYCIFSKANGHLIKEGKFIHVKDVALKKNQDELAQDPMLLDQINSITSSGSMFTCKFETGLMLTVNARNFE